MPAKGIADVVFVIDASGSMKPCINALRANIGTFADSLYANSVDFDLRLEFIALRVDPTESTFKIESSRSDEVWGDLYLKSDGGQGSSSKFWSNAEDFRKGLERVQVGADEDSLVALDFALDLPWRTAAACHRIVVLLTDEPVETGFQPEVRATMASKLVGKLVDLRIKLFIVGPYSPVFVELSAADGAEFTEIKDEEVGKGLATTDFRKVLGTITKSISVASLQSIPKSAKRGLFEQERWSHHSRFDLNTGS